MNISFEADIPESQGILSKTISEFIDACEDQNLQLSTFMLICNNKAIASFGRGHMKKIVFSFCTRLQNHLRAWG